MKKITGFFFLMVISAHVLTKLLIIALFTFNQQFIIDRYCENKNKPAMHCDGKCYLKKQLSKDEQKENAKSQLLQEIIEIPLFLSQDDKGEHTMYSTYEPFLFAPYACQYSFIFSSPTFHPPAA